MLILTRRTNETIQVGDNITIMVCRVAVVRVRIGVQAPDDVKIWRGESQPDESHSAQTTECELVAY